MEIIKDHQIFDAFADADTSAHQEAADGILFLTPVQEEQCVARLQDLEMKEGYITISAVWRCNGRFHSYLQRQAQPCMDSSSHNLTWSAELVVSALWLEEDVVDPEEDNVAV